MALSNYATNFAIIENGIVTNIIWGNIYNASDFPNAVQIDDLAVQIGDTYVDDVFFHDGVTVQAVVDEQEDMKAALELLGVQANG